MPKASAAPVAPPRKDGLIDPKALMAIRNLELRARLVVEGFWSGIHRSPYHGFSVEFTEYRAYSQGDDTRFLDWRLYARSDRYYIKKFEDETNLRCHLLVDLSRSLGYGSLGYSKADYARTLAATLALFLNNQGDAVGLFTFDERVRDYVPARNRHGHLRQLMLKLESEPGGRATNLNEPLRRAAELTRKRGLVIFISDLLAPVAELERSLGRLTAAGHEVEMFQVLDPNELEFNFKSAMLFEDSESGRDLYLDPETVRAEYRRGLEAHSHGVGLMCRRLGIAFHPLQTNRPLELALLDFLRGRNRRDRLATRRNPQTSARPAA
jgi:uncharacterized protein (DUF58 family)